MITIPDEIIPGSAKGIEAAILERYPTLTAAAVSYHAEGQIAITIDTWQNSDRPSFDLDAIRAWAQHHAVPVTCEIALLQWCPGHGKERRKRLAKMIKDHQ